MTTVTFKTNWDLEEDEYPECCGVRVIKDFPDELGYTILSSLYSLKETENQSGCPGMLVAVINRGQFRNYNKELVAAGFEMVRKARNPKTENMIYLYVCLINQPQPRPKVKKRRF